jgi:hypothetical protein
MFANQVIWGNGQHGPLVRPSVRLPRPGRLRMHGIWAGREIPTISFCGARGGSWPVAEMTAAAGRPTPMKPNLVC